jgi:putative ABC transport system permease protein
MSAADLLRFASGALRGHRVRSVLSLLGVAIGVLAVILLTSLGEGARLYVVGEFAALGSNLLIVIPGKTETTGMAPAFGGAPHDLTVADADALLRHVRGVRRVAPMSVGTAPARYGGRSRDTLILGTTSEMREVRKLRMGVGRYLPEGAAARAQLVCVIGTSIQSELFRGVNPLGESLRIGDERFRVIGVLAARGVSLGLNLDEVVHVPVEASLQLFNRTSLLRILVETASHEEIEPAKKGVVSVLTERHAGEEDVTVLTQDAVVTTFGKILSVLTAAVAGIAAISLTVAGVGIMNVMLVSVSERTREIGLLKALGVTSGQVLAVFLAEAALLSTAGGAAGLLAGLGAVRLLREVLPSFPARPPDWALFSAVAVSISVGLLFGALPARRAARLDPIAALTGR